jgi:hypothetical protein
MATAKKAVKKVVKKVVKKPAKKRAGLVVDTRMKDDEDTASELDEELYDA